LLKAIIFDFDGVISDSELLHWQSFNEVLADFGIKLARQEYFDRYLGFTDTELIEKVFAEKGIQSEPDSIKDLIARKGVVFGHLARRSGHIISGVRETVEMLRQNGLLLAICSGASKADIDVMLEGSGLEEFFSVIISADDVARGKPDPEGYLLTLAKISELFGERVSPADCVVIEDSHWGIEAGAGAGMAVVAVTNSYGPEDLGTADKVVSNLKDLRIEDFFELCE